MEKQKHEAKGSVFRENPKLDSSFFICNCRNMAAEELYYYQCRCSDRFNGECNYAGRPTDRKQAGIFKG